MRYTDFPLRWLLGVFILLSLAYAWATPVFEASDELWHFGMVDHIARTGQLPVQVVGVETPWEQEGSQPPLYYLIAAALVAPVDRSDIDTLRQPNPHVKAGIPGASDNKNLVLHDEIHPPLQKTALAVYMARIFSIVLGCVTVSAVYACAHLLGGRDVALLAAGLTAFNPMFLFITASVNNDNLVTALNSVVIYLMLRMLRDGFNTRRSVLIAVLVALASLTKLSGLVLVPVVALAALWVLRRQKTGTRGWRGLMTLGVSLAAAWLVIAGWWYVRNIALYHEVFGTQTMVAVAGPRVGDFTLQTMLDEFQGFRIAYWGLFGAVNILTFEAFYVVMDAVVVLAICGLVWHVWRIRKEPDDLAPLALLALTIVIGAVSVISWTSQTYASQGRLLFPYAAATSTLLAFGLFRFFPAQVRRFSAIFSACLFGAFAVIVPFASIMPQYAPPLPLLTLPDTARQVYARFGDVALVGYEAPDRRYQPGDEVPVTVYWQVIERSERDFSLFLTALDAEGDAIGKVDTYPGGGRLRTSTWQPDVIYPDHYSIPLAKDAAGDFKLRIQVGWWYYPTEAYVEAVDENGQTLQGVILDVGGFADGENPVLPNDMVATESVDFGDAIRLLGYTLIDNDLSLWWESTGTLTDDHTVFVQVLDGDDTIVGQGDAPPSLPTRYRLPGERFVTRHTIYYPQPPAAGIYRVVIGWYRPDDFTRLAADFPDNAYPLMTISLP